MEIDLSVLPVENAHDLFSSALIPRPIAWVSSIDAQGRVNLAPFSFFTGITWSPPTLCFSVANRRDGTPKDTILNVRATGSFVVNMVSEDLAPGMVATSATLPPGFDEAQSAGIQMTPSSRVSAPRVRQARIAFECVLDRIVTVGEGACAGNLVLGTVMLMHVCEEIMTPEGTVDCVKLNVVGRLSGTKYCHVRSVFEMNP